MIGKYVYSHVSLLIVLLAGVDIEHEEHKGGVSKIQCGQNLFS
jgi:hypothetical protein